jgi:hypothetical protein
VALSGQMPVPAKAIPDRRSGFHAGPPAADELDPVAQTR